MARLLQHEYVTAGHGACRYGTKCCDYLGGGRRRRQATRRKIMRVRENRAWRKEVNY